MAPFTVVCDRCKKEVHGFKMKGPLSGTSGFYRGDPAVKDDLWGRYMNDGEHTVCDACMWADERYLADYPSMRGYNCEEQGTRIEHIDGKKE